MKRIAAFIKREMILCIAGLLAVISLFFVPPDRQYLQYVDYQVLALLFCLMTVMEGFKCTGLFEKMAMALLCRVHTFRQLYLVLVLLCFFSSMWITNDVALLTFVPLCPAGASGGGTAEGSDSGDPHADHCCKSWKYGNPCGKSPESVPVFQCGHGTGRVYKDPWTAYDSIPAFDPGSLSVPSFLSVTAGNTEVHDGRAERSRTESDRGVWTQ